MRDLVYDLAGFSAFILFIGAAFAGCLAIQGI